MLARSLGLLALLLAGACSHGGGGSSFSFATTAPASASIRAAYGYTAAVREAAGTPTYRLISAPDGMALSGSRLDWTPAYEDLGEHPITLQVDDGAQRITQSWTLRVDQGVDLGVTLSPRLHTMASMSQDYTEHFSQHAPWGRLIAFHSSWRDSLSDDGEIPVAALTGVLGAQDYGFLPAIGFGWADGDGNPDLSSESEPGNNSWTNQETRDEYLQMVSTFAQTYQPPYLFLGNEINAYYLNHTPAEWNAWLSEYEACYDAIKSVSPNTSVFTVFQLERMKGLGSSTTGWTEHADWRPLQDIVATGRLDAVGFTSYPYFAHATPLAIPADYYDEILDRWNGPVVFTEIGWLAEPAFPYPGGDADQAAFVARFFALTDDLDLGYVAWLFLHDLDVQALFPAFMHIGLRSNDGSLVRTADTTWRSEVLLRESR